MSLLLVKPYRNSYGTSPINMPENGSSGVGPPNAITLSCKSRPPRRPPAAGRAPRLTLASEGAMCARHAAAGFGAAQRRLRRRANARRLLSAC